MGVLQKVVEAGVLTQHEANSIQRYFVAEDDEVFMIDVSNVTDADRDMLETAILFLSEQHGPDQ